MSSEYGRTAIDLRRFKACAAVNVLREHKASTELQWLVINAFSLLLRSEADSLVDLSNPVDDRLRHSPTIK